MMLFNSARAHATRLGGAVAQLAQPFLLGGPVGVFYAVKLAWLRARAARISLYIHREQELHRANLKALNHELNEVISAEQGANIAAAQFWRWCDKKAVQS